MLKDMFYYLIILLMYITSFITVSYLLFSSYFKAEFGTYLKTFQSLFKALFGGIDFFE